MKRSPVPSLSRLTLRLPGLSMPKGWGSWLRTRLKLEELEGRDVPAVVVINPSFGSLNYACLSENGSFFFVGTQSFGLGDTGCIASFYDAHYSVNNGSLFVDLTQASSLGISVSGEGTNNLDLTGSLGNLGTLSFNAGIIYSPTLNFFGIDQINVQLDSSTEQSGSGNATIFVSPVADAPNLSITQAVQYGNFTEFGPIASSVFNVPALASTGGTTGSYQYLDVAVPADEAPDLGSTGGLFFFSTPPDFTLVTDGFGNPVVRILSGFGNSTDYTGNFFFNSQMPVEPSTFVFELTAVQMANATDPNGQLFTSTASTTGTFTVTFVPQTQFEVATTSGENSPLSVDLALTDPTAGNDTTDDYNLQLTAANGTFATIDPTTAGLDLAVVGNGTTQVSITGNLPQIQQYLDSGDVNVVPTANFTGALSLQASLGGIDFPPSVPLGFELASVPGPTRVGTSCITVQVINTTPSVTLKAPDSTNEDEDGATGFTVDPTLLDPLSEGGNGYTLELDGINGTFTALDPDSFELGCISVVGSGTSTLDIHGDLGQIQEYLDASGVSFITTQYFSGNANLTASFTTPDERTASDAAVVEVIPVASSFNVFGNFDDFNIAANSTYVLGTDYYSINPWADDKDGSESVTYTIGFDPEEEIDASQFQFLTTTGAPLSFDSETGTWSLTTSYTDPADLQASLDSLEVITPAGFNGFLDVQLNLTLTDVAIFGGAKGGHLDESFASTESEIEIDVPPSVTLPTITVAEGQTVDLGSGQYAASDPSGFEFQEYALTFTVSGGTLQANPALADDALDIEDNPDGSISLYGELNDINNFLAQPNSLVYIPTFDEFSGVVPIEVTLYYDFPGEGEGCGTAFTPLLVTPLNVGGNRTEDDDLENIFQGTSYALFTPVADVVQPQVQNVETGQDTPVALPIFVDTRDLNVDETVTIFVSNMPAGSSLNGGESLGDGVWQLSLDDLDRLIFRPPPGQTGTYTLTVEVVITDPGEVLALPPTNGCGTGGGGCVSEPGVLSFLPSLAPDDEGDPDEPNVKPAVSMASTTLMVIVDPPGTVRSEHHGESPPTPPPIQVTQSPPTSTTIVNLPPASSTTTTTTTYATVTSSTVDTVATVLSLSVTTPTATTATATNAVETTAAFGMIPGADQKLSISTDTVAKPSALPALGSPAAAAASVSASFTAGRERHPLQPIQALEHDSATTLFEGSGDSFPLVDQLYRDHTAPAGGAAPKSSGESPMSMIPWGPIALPGDADLPIPAAAVAVVAFPTEADTESMVESAERNANTRRNDSNTAPESSFAIMKSVALGLLPLLCTAMMTDGKRSSPVAHRWLQHLLFKPRTREGVL